VVTKNEDRAIAALLGAKSSAMEAFYEQSGVVPSKVKPRFSTNGVFSC
jgi:hypothetical protein